MQYKILLTSAVNNKGFSLLELMITLAIIAILLTIALPSFQDTISRTRLETEVDNLFHDLHYSRMLAINRGTSVSICPSSNSTSCTGGTDFSVGWIVFIDANANGVKDAVEEIARVKGAPSNLSIDSGDTYYCYNSLGMVCN